MSNQFKSFAAGGGANAMTATDWAALTALLANGFQSGVVNSAQVNTLLRQVSSMAQMVGDFISGQGYNAVDDGNIANLLTAFKSAMGLFNCKTTSGSSPANWLTFEFGNGATDTPLIQVLINWSVSTSSSAGQLTTLPMAFKDTNFAVVGVDTGAGLKTVTTNPVSSSTFRVWEGFGGTGSPTYSTGSFHAIAIGRHA